MLDMGTEHQWTSEYDDGGKFEKFFLKLQPYQQAVVQACIEQVLERLGQDICEGRWGTSLGGGLFEFRVDTTLRAVVGEELAEELGFGGDQPRVLVRLFCAFHGQKIIMLHHGYNKGKDPSEKRQEKEIKVARKLHKAWKNKKS